MPRDAWHHLGAPTSKCTSASAALKKGNLTGWNLRKLPLWFEDTEGIPTLNRPVPDQFALTRDNHHTGVPEALGVVGIGHTVVQNEGLIPLLDSLAGSLGARHSTAGEIDGGRRVFVSLELPGQLRIGGDVVKNYVTVLAGRDGQSGTYLLVTPVHTATGTLLNGETSDFASSTKLASEHTDSLVEFVFDCLDSFQAATRVLADKPLRQSVFEQVISSRFGAPKGSPGITRTRYQNKLDRMAALYAKYPDNRWAAFCALAEWHDHFSPVRGVDSAPEELRRARKAVLEPSFKNYALRVMLSSI